MQASEGSCWFQRISTTIKAAVVVPRNSFRQLKRRQFERRSINPLLVLVVRGGGGAGSDDTASTNEATKSDQHEDDDEERYSRQVYTLGKRAHGLIRSSTVYLDGPATSGLTYETAKNLALSGIRRLVLVVAAPSSSSSSSTEQAQPKSIDETYHNADMDDLGKAYIRASISEVIGDESSTNNSSSSSSSSSDASSYDEIFLGYIKRLNPSVQVSRVERSALFSTSPSSVSNKHDDDEKLDDDGNHQQRSSVLVSIDRPYATQVALNKMARQAKMSFVAIETAGVFGRTFCDFGDSFKVHDADGETPLVTPLLRLELLLDQQDKEDDATNQQSNHDDDDDEVHKDNSLLLVVHCIVGEKHDVSKGDVVKFLHRNGEMSIEQCTVQEVQNPFRFVAQLDLGGRGGATGREQQQQQQDQQSMAVVKDFIARVNAQASSFSRVKIPQDISFCSLTDAVKIATRQDGGVGDNDDIFTPCDLDKSCDPVRRRACFACFQALSAFVQEEGRLPGMADKEDFAALVQEEYGQSWWPNDASDSGNNDDSENKKAGKREKKKREEINQHVHNFLHGCSAKLSPFQAVLGAVGAQETLKAATGLYYPVKQFLLYDCDEVLQEGHQGNGNFDDKKNTMAQSSENRGLRHILGNDIVDKLQEQRIFVVGAGAIGCEILKNLASMGVATRKGGCVVITDMDTIEKSNLSRQLLFRDADLGKFKSSAAQEAMRRFHPALSVEAHSSKVGGSERQTPFGDQFWSRGVDIVLNALDNVDARVYMDGQCVANQKALVDAGTMGPKGNVQVVVPNQSESYASSVDPPEEGIPICTLKNFPYAISHTIQWGRDLFDGLYRRRPTQANDILDSLQSSTLDELASKLLSDAGEESALQTAKELAEDLSVFSTGMEEGEDMAAQIRSHALSWAVRLASKLYSEAVDELLQQHPLDSLDEDGEPFWSGIRRPPQRLTYNTANDDDTEQALINLNLVDFVGSAARLRAESFLSDKLSSFTTQDVKEALETLSSDPGTCQASTGSDHADQSARIVIRTSLESVLPDSVKLIIAEFEKDDDSNGHVAFVNAASNLRAIGYGIPPVDAMETRRVAGNIVPAMITTTAFVSALSCIELIKLVQKAPLKSHRNAFINLALPFFAFTIPLPAELIQGLKGKEYTLWDRLHIKENKKAAAKGGLTLKNLIKKIKKLAAQEDPESVAVVSISYGPYLLFANFLHEDDADVLGSTIWDLVKEAVESDSDNPDRPGNAENTASVSLAVNSIDLTVIVEDSENGEEAELPSIRLVRYKTKDSAAANEHEASR
jgi:ubiquitin-activating enzyme E1